jgi:uncharacterized protein YggT (Ycf19 family)
MVEDDRRPATTTTVEPVTPRPSGVAAKIAQIIWVIIVIIVILLSIRVVFALVGANLDNPFASFIYTVTEPFIAPFRGLLQVSQAEYGVARFEFETMIAIFVYLMLGWGITALINVLSRPAVA